jgi:ribosomal protein L11 methyltransferase
MAWWEARIQPVPQADLQGWYGRWSFPNLLGVEELPLPGEQWPLTQPWETHPQGVEPTHVEVKMWFEGNLPDNLHELLPEGASLLLREVHDEGWATTWKDGFPRIEISPRLCVAPPWNSEPGDVILNPGVGFGTGHHATTAAALRLLDRVADSCSTALDVGSGSGILTIAARHLGIQARGIEIDPSAVLSANANAELNHQFGGFANTPLDQVEGPFDCVLANLHAELIVDMWQDLIERSDHWLVLAGILEDRVGCILDLVQAPFVVVHQETCSPWVALLLERTS